MLPLGQEFLLLASTDRAGLCGFDRPRRQGQIPAASFFRFASQDREKLTEGGTEEFSIEATFPVPPSRRREILHRQRFRRQQAIVVDELLTGLVEKLPALIGEVLMKPGDALPGLAPIARAGLSATDDALRPAERR